MKRAPITHEVVFTDASFAEEYAQKHRQMAERFGREYADKLSARAFRSGRVLDVGCGFGATLLVLAEHFGEAEFAGIDLSDPLLHLARESAEGAGLASRVRFEHADAQQIPYGDDAFDVVLNANMVHLVDDPLAMLNEMERVLSPGGAFYIADLRRSWLGWIEREIRSALAVAEARELLRRSALRVGVFTHDLLWWRYETEPSG
jgi:ubiquinone/menaquinone biosynthesis C-methylase UbiE